MNGNIKIPTFIKNPENTARINLTRTDDNKLIIDVECEPGISNIKYNWNNEEEQIITLEGVPNIQKIIDIPIGQNILSIEVTDVNGAKTSKQERFIIELPKPEIELSVVGNYIKIIVTSEIELSKVTYGWGENNQKTENILTYQDRTKFETQIEIPLGKNTLKIKAIDVNGNENQKEQDVKGITKAKTTIETKDGYVHFTVVGTENIKTVEFEFNGKKYLMNKDTYGETQTVHYKVKLIKGKNTLKVISTTDSDGVDITEWEEKYTAE